METIASAVLLGVAVLFAGNLPWSVMLAPLSLRVLPGVPWALVPMAIYLWLYCACGAHFLGISVRPSFPPLLRVPPFPPPPPMP